AANENAKPRSRGVTGELRGGENGSDGSPDRPVHQCSSHAHVGAQDPRKTDAAIPAIVVTPATSATAPTLDDPATASTPITQATPAPATRADACPRPRARQNIQPALRRAVLGRDRQCRVPGCNHSTF